jgi:hypothetical protein
MITRKIRKTVLINTKICRANGNTPSTNRLNLVQFGQKLTMRNWQRFITQSLRALCRIRTQSSIDEIT